MGHIEEGRKGYEERDAKAKPVVYTGVILAITGAVGLLAAGGFYRGLETMTKDAEGEPSPMYKAEKPVEPLLQDMVRQTQDLADYRAEMKGKLEGYAWIDKDLGIVRIPVTRAMELVAERGLPNWKPAPPPAPVDVPTEGTP